MSKRTGVQPGSESTPTSENSGHSTNRTGLGDDHPLNDIIGTHEGPIWEDILKNIKRNRKEADRIYWASDQGGDK